MVVVGADVHKRTHTFVAVDEVGKELGHKTFPATLLVIRTRSGGRGGDSDATWCGPSRTVATSRPGWSGTCSALVSRWCACRRR